MDELKWIECPTCHGKPWKLPAGRCIRCGGRWAIPADDATADEWVHARPVAAPADRWESVPLTVWRFHEAPAELQAVSDNGGDEDWLAEVPPHLVDAPIGWMQVGAGDFAVCGLNEYDHPERPGWKVRIGVHS